jgi:hypothetical protein
MMGHHLQMSQQKAQGQTVHSQLLSLDKALPNHQGRLLGQNTFSTGHFCVIDFFITCMYLRHMLFNSSQ